MDEPSKLETRYLRTVAMKSTAGLRLRRRVVLGIAIASFLALVAYYGSVIASDGFPMDNVHAGPLGTWLLVVGFMVMAYDRLTFLQGAVEYHERQQRP